MREAVSHYFIVCAMLLIDDHSVNVKYRLTIKALVRHFLCIKLESFMFIYIHFRWWEIEVFLGTVNTISILNAFLWRLTIGLLVDYV